jgi:pentatricopeptide repeat protein
VRRVRACLLSTSYESAIKQYTDMYDKGRQWDVHVYNDYLTALCHTGQLTKAMDSLFASFALPNSQSYICVLQYLVSHRDWDSIKDFLSFMKKNNVSLMWDEVHSLFQQDLSFEDTSRMAGMMLQCNTVVESQAQHLRKLGSTNGYESGNDTLENQNDEVKMCTDIFSSDEKLDHDLPDQVEVSRFGWEDMDRLREEKLQELLVRGTIRDAVYFVRTSGLKITDHLEAFAKAICNTRNEDVSWNRFTELRLSFPLNGSHLESILVQYLDSNMMRNALKVYELAISSGHTLQPSAVYRLMDVLSTNNPETVLLLFSQRCQMQEFKNERCLTPVITALCMQGKAADAFLLVKEFSESGIKFSEETLLPIVRAYCTLRPIEEVHELVDQVYKVAGTVSERSYLPVLEQLILKGDLDGAIDLYEKMVDMQVSPGAETYSLLIKSLCVSGQLVDALLLFDRMKIQGFAPSDVVYNVLISGLSRDGLLYDARDLLEQARPGKVVIQLDTWNDFVSCLCSSEFVGEAEMVLKEMRDAQIVPDLETYKLLIKAHCNFGRPFSAAALLYEMHAQDSLIPDSSIFETLLCSIDQFSSPNKSTDVLKLMIALQVPPNEGLLSLLSKWQQKFLVSSSVKELIHTYLNTR